jgi:hypothetical protein
MIHEKRSPAETGRARLDDVDLLGGDHQHDSETRSEQQVRRIARKFFLPPHTAATVARLAYDEVAR